jgi:hypothetical protein
MYPYRYAYTEMRMGGRPVTAARVFPLGDTDTIPVRTSGE